MYQLYYSPGACSMAIHIVLNELGIPFEGIKVNLQAGENRKPEFLKINPRGMVPVLVEDGVTIREGAAMLIHLMEKHSSPLLPKNEPARTKALEWLMFANATLHPAYGRGFFLLKNVTDKAALEPLFKVNVAIINKLWEEVDTQLANNRYIAGNQMTSADILITVIANWGAHFPLAPTLGKNAQRLFAEVSALPSFQKALKDEGVEYKIAA